MFAITILTDGAGHFSLNTTGLGRDQSREEIVALLRGVIEGLAPIALPVGWAPTLDGVDVAIVDGVVSHSRGYVLTHGGPDGAVVEERSAPCAADGSPTAATVAALSA